MSSLHFYGYAVIQILIEPGRFFSEKAGMPMAKKALAFFIGCSVVFVLSSLVSGGYPRSVISAAILFANCMGLLCISSALSYMIMVMTLGRQTTIQNIFTVYAFASGVTSLFSWVTGFIWFTEPWKWWLVYTGFREGCGFGRGRALFIVGITVIVQFFLIYSLYLAFYK